ncbi:hypothetical protein [Nocardioides lijunqiniae]|uniref:hypothetical protein n=1 Tax=Nocardioides lijunqiniae TaxID=2760832 RepID=UPI0018781C36|nr:hypothetical protein [Nocardioides lijunqiniae]
MSDQPLGSPTPDTAPVIREPSIVDTILDLDKFLSSDVRLAEKTARFCTRPDLEAKLDELEHQLALLVDEAGRPLPGTDDSLAGADGAGEALAVAQEIYAVRQEMAAAFRSVRMRQLPDDEWQAFKVEHKEAMDSTEQGPARVRMLDELLLKSAVAPKISASQLAQLRHQVGAPQVDELIEKAWAVNTQSGVSVPKSPRSSAALRRLLPGAS